MKIVLIHIILIVTNLTFLFAQSTKISHGNGIKADKSSPDIVFSHLSEKDGLSYNLVTDIIQDKDGILWIGTLFGLNRFDGKRFEVFKKNKIDKQAIHQNVITELCEDPDGNIWGSTEDGIFCFDKKNNIFSNYSNPDVTIYPRTHSILCDQRGQIWAGSDAGLIKFHRSNSRFQFFVHDPADSTSISHSRVGKNAIAEDPKGRGLWIATQKGLNLFLPEKNKFINYRNHTSEIYNDHDVNALFVSKSGMIWYFDGQTKEIIGFKNPEEGVLFKIPISGAIKNPYGGLLFETSYHHLWYSSNSYETVKIEYLNGNKMELIKNDISNPASISGDYIGGAWEDRDKSVWFGTIAGISRFNINRMFYKTEKLSAKYPELDNNWQITCLSQNPVDKKWWVGTRDGKVYLHDALNNISEMIDFPSMSKKDAGAGFITDIEFINGKAIFCFAGKRTYQYDIKSKKYMPFEGLKGSYTDYKTRVIVQESDSTYIFGNNNVPLLRWNSISGKLEEIRYKNQNAKNGSKYGGGWLCASKGKGTWLAASGSTVGYIHPGDSIIQTIPLKIGMEVNQGGFYNSMNVDRNGDVWFSFIAQGLYRLRKIKDRISSENDVELKLWDSSNGLINENIQSSVMDVNGKIWCSAFNKFSVFNPSTNNFFNFKVSLSENNSFYYNYVIPLENGHILTNIKGNLVEFFPERIVTEYPNNEPIISILQLPNKKIYLSGQEKVTLEPHENFITISFGCTSIQEYYPYKFSYMLEGINSSWVEADQKAEATYSDLSPGRYTFRLKAVSTDNKWESKEKTIQIIIKAPFYKTWWFTILVVFIIGAILFYILRARIKNIKNINQLKSKAQLLEKEKTVVMYENLKQHLNPHFLFNSLTSLSSLIRIDPKQAGDFLDKMSKVYRYILKNKDNETVPLIEELKFVELYNQLQKTRFSDGLIITIDIPEDLQYRKIAPVTLQNLVENAIKHNIADAETPLYIKIYSKDDYLIVQNNLQKKNFVETSNKQGQNSMISLYRYLSSRPVMIEENDKFYTVRIPLI